MLDIVELSRLQFVLTAMYHPLFVSLTLDMAFLLAITETVYALSGKQIYKDMTKFWSKLFGINFALDMATGLIMEFQFETSWSYYPHYVGDIFGTPLAVEDLMAFFLGSTFAGLFFFGWGRPGKVQHICATWLMVSDSNLSALWVLVANGRMQNSIASNFDFETTHVEIVSFSELVPNPATRVKFVHTVASGYVTGAMLILGISAWYILKGRGLAFAKRSFAIATSFSMVAVLSATILGDESGHEIGDVQETKLAVIEVKWETRSAPAAFTLFGTPDQEEETSKLTIQVPYVLGIITIRSVDTLVIGLKELMVQHEERVRNGMKTYSLLEQPCSGPTGQAVRDQFNSTKRDPGYGPLLKCYMSNMADAIEVQIQQATEDSIPRVAPLYFAFHIMVARDFLLLATIALSFWNVIRNRTGEKKWFLYAALYGIPLPWVAVGAGWFVAEYGRQLWAIGEVLSTVVTDSSLTASDLIFSVVLICDLYILSLVAELFLTSKFARLGPGSLKTDRCHFEQSSMITQPTH